MYFIAADGGGSKLSVVLFDENMNLVSEGSAGGTNTTFRPGEDVRADMQAAVDACLAPLRGGGRIEIESAECVIVGPAGDFEACLRRRAELRKFVSRDECSFGLAAGAGEEYGLLALSGTGSDVFIAQPGYKDVIGGWGTVLGDEGSGYDIGARVLRAAIYSHDGRGPKSRLEELVREKYRLSEMWDLVPAIYGSADQRRTVADATRLLSAAGDDPAAVSICEYAGETMADMAAVIAGRHGGSWIGPAVAAGGVWKADPKIFEAFSRRLKRHFPQADIRFPEFDPVVGGAVLTALSRGLKRERFWDDLKRSFAGYRISGRGMLK